MIFETEHGAVDRLLPWYANGSLEADARRRVAAHLQDCATCREELKFLGNVRATLRASVATEPARKPAANAGFESLPTELQRRLVTAPAHTAHRWLPAMAAALFATFGLTIAIAVAWLDAPRFQTATHSAGTAQSQVQVVVRFVPDTELGEITALLRRHRAVIVNGPDERDQWLLEIPVVDAARARDLLPELRAAPGVEHVERASAADQSE